jgi:hypothetical protein
MSNESNVRRWRSQNNKVLLSVLLLTATLNTSQAMVLCEGEDGHIAIEPVGWNCCTRTWQTDGARATGSPIDTTTRFSNTRCPSCVDTPIGGSACDKPRTASTPKIRPADSAVLWETLQAPGTDAAIVLASELLTPAAASCTFLSSIVLRM